MLPKNNRNIYPDVSNSQSSPSHVNQPFRPSLSPLYSNLIVTQQQQPQRIINNNFQTAHPNNNTIRENATKRFAAAMHQPQNGPLHLLGRSSNSPVQINTPGANQQIVLDRQQLIRLPQPSSNLSEAAQMNNIYQALYLIQQNLKLQNDNKALNNHQSDIHRSAPSTNNSIMNNNGTNTMNINSNSQPTIHSTTPNIALSSSSQNQNTTVFTVSNSDLQILEAISRLNSQQSQKQTNHSNVSLIQSDCSVAQQLLNALHKQNSRTNCSANTMSSPGFMVIGSSGTKPSQLITTKDPVNNPVTSSQSNTHEVSNSPLLKMPLTSKADIPVWTKLLEKLSNNPENIGEVNRNYKIREMEENPRKINTKILPQSRVFSETTKYHSKEYHKRHNDLLIASNSLKTSAMSTTPSSNIDTRQILRDSKIISYMMPSSNNVSINNDDMVNQHFRESLRDIKKSNISNSQLNYKPFESPNTNLDKPHLNNTTLNMLNIRKKSYGSFIDLERPEYSNTRVSTPNQAGQSLSNNNHLSIKETADAMVESLIKKSLECKYSSSKHKAGLYNTTTVGARPEVTQDLVTRDYGLHRTGYPLISTHCDNVVINARDSFINSTSMFQDPNDKNPKFTSIRPNPSKSDLPLKKRIMLDFNENCEEDIPEFHTAVKNVDSKSEMSSQNIKIENTEEKVFKIRRKRVHSDSITNDKKSLSPSQDLDISSIKKHRGRKPGSGKNQRWKEECRLKEIAIISQAGKEETWQELIKTIIKPPDIESISAKTLTSLDLEPLKLSKEHFFQIGSCSEIAPRMVKCRCCRQSTTSNNIESSNNTVDDVSSTKSGSKDSSTTTVISSFCRFHGFRKLQFSVKGTLVQAGFCKSNEADTQDLSLWRMYQPLPSEMSVSIATYIVESLNFIFCEIINTENKFLQESYDTTNDLDFRSVNSRNGQVNVHNIVTKPVVDGFVWKRPVQGVREMCDVCETSIFNSHWGCRKCGYSICVDCFSERNDSLLYKSSSSDPQDSKEKDNEPLQTVTSNICKNVVHPNTRGSSKNLYFSCDHPWAVCTANKQQHNPEQMLKVELIPIKVINELRNRMHTIARLLNIRLKCNCLKSTKSESETKLPKQMSLESIPLIESDNMSSGNYDLHMLADIALKEVVNAGSKDNEERSNLTGIPRPPPVLSPPHHPENNGNISCVTQDLKKTEINVSIYSWISVSSNFKMMHLHDAQSPDNLKLFQQEWRRAHPVLVSSCHNTMDLSLWTPEKFLEEFESEPALFVDCESGFPVPRATMKSFWEGFSCVSKRICCSDSSTKPACLKLKDWPPSDDLNDVLPQRCKDIMSNLPIKEYTGRQGEFNLAAHLSDFFVRPDLGPKLYNAYGMPRESKLGTTNLHLDIADAVNVMLYIGIPSDLIEKETQNTLDSMKEAKVDDCVIKRADKELPGALWHIFLPKDVPKLREFLNDVLLERGESLNPNHDPIHDQQFYLNQTLLDRLKEEKKVEGCAIIQFRGDAVFIPAGSPHQVRNLHSCMKVANDFVSPENILNCLLVTKEFRKLSSTHANHEDKLQAKNMIFHAMKDAVSTLIMKSTPSLSEINGKPRDFQLKRRRSIQTEDSKLASWLVKEESLVSVDAE